MTHKSRSIFREEAVAHHAASGEPQGEVLRIVPSWTQWTFWLLLAMLVTGALFALLVTVNRYATGPALVQAEPGQAPVVTVLLAGHADPCPVPGAPLRLQLSDRRSAYLDLTVTAVTADNDEAAVRLFGQPGILVQASIPDGIPLQAGMTGKAEVRVGSERLLTAILPGWGRSLRGGDRHVR